MEKRVGHLPGGVLDKDARSVALNDEAWMLPSLGGEAPSSNIMKTFAADERRREL